METTPTIAAYNALRIELAETRLELAAVTAAHAILHSSVAGTLSAPVQPGPRWRGAEH